MKERFQCAPVGAHLKRCLSFEIPRFRYRQQPKLREMILVKFWFWSFWFFWTQRVCAKRRNLKRASLTGCDTSRHGA